MVTLIYLSLHNHHFPHASIFNINIQCVTRHRTLNADLITSPLLLVLPVHILHIYTFHPISSAGSVLYQAYSGPAFFHLSGSMPASVSVESAPSLVVIPPSSSSTSSDPDPSGSLKPPTPSPTESPHPSPATCPTLPHATPSVPMLSPGQAGHPNPQTPGSTPTTGAAPSKTGRDQTPVKSPSLDHKLPDDFMGTSDPSVLRSRSRLGESQTPLGDESTDRRVPYADKDASKPLPLEKYTLYETRTSVASLSTVSI